MLRGLAFTAVFYLWSGTVAIAMTPILLGPRRWTLAMLSGWAKGTIGLLRLFGVKVEFRGLEHMPTGPALIGAKHQCMFDTFGPWAYLPDAAYVMKQELLSIPWFGWYALKGENIVLDRSGAASALKKLVRDARSRIEEGRQVLIFPEGTRTPVGQKGEYKPGVAALYTQLGVDCTPLATNSGVHWPKPGKARPPGTIVFEFLPVIPAGLKRAEFMAELETRIETASERLLSE